MSKEIQNQPEEEMDTHSPRESTLEPTISSLSKQQALNISNNQVQIEIVNELEEQDINLKDFSKKIVTEDENDVFSDHMGRLSQDLLVQGDPIENAKAEKIRKMNEPKGYLQNTQKYEKLKDEFR